MSKEKIGMYSDQIRGVSYKESDIHDSLNDKSIILLRANNIFENEINFDNVVYVDKSRVTKKQYLQKGDIVVCASSGSKHLVGKAAQVDFDTEVTFGAFLKVVRPKNILANYLGYYFLSNEYRRTISSISEGANINNIRNEHIDELLISIVDKDTQKKRSEILDKVYGILKRKKQLLNEYDQLIKSRFVEMFMNKGYHKEILKNIAVSKAEYGAASASVPHELGRPRYVRITDINDDGTLNDNVVCSNNLKDDINYKLSYGDFLFARMGATVGKTYAFYEGNEIFAGYLIRYKLNLNKINPRYLFTYTKLEEYMSWVNNNQSGAAQPGINARKYDELTIPLAPIELQNEFALFVEQVDKLKFAVQKSLEETQRLFDALMQQYFG